MTLVDTLGHLLSAADPKTEGGYSLVTAERLAEVIRADPAAARAVRDAIDPDGLRAALNELLPYLRAARVDIHDSQRIDRIERLLEGTPDAD